MGGGASKSTASRANADAIFNEIDANRDGKLSVKELTIAAMQRDIQTAWPKWLIEETIARYDTDHDHMLDREEWARAFATLRTPAQKKEEIGFTLAPLKASDAGDVLMLSTLKKLLETDPTKLGKGRDCAGWGPYDRLHLVRAWRLDDDGEAARYDAAREDMFRDMEMLGRKGKNVKKVPGLPIQTAAACTGPFALDANASEAVLLNGLKAELLYDVLSTGLNERFAGSNVGTLFGAGVYFGEDAGKADQYSSPDTQYDQRSKVHQLLYNNSCRHPGNENGGVFYALVCRVALGYPARTQQSRGGQGDGRRLLPPRHGPPRAQPHSQRRATNVPSLAHHRARRQDRAGRLPSEQICPRYLIAYQRVAPGKEVSQEWSSQSGGGAGEARGAGGGEGAKGGRGARAARGGGARASGGGLS